MRASGVRPKGVSLRPESPNRRRGFLRESLPNVASTWGHAPVTEVVAHPAANGPLAIEMLPAADEFADHRRTRSNGRQWLSVAWESDLLWRVVPHSAMTT